MIIVPYLYTQNELLQGIKQRMRDADGQRWTATEIYNAVNDGVRVWGERVTVPLVYTLTDGFTMGTFEYAIPSYIREPMDVQAIRYLNQYLNGIPLIQDITSVSTWQDLPGWSLEPDGAGGQTLRLETVPWTTSARIIWQAQQGPVPTSICTLTDNVGGSDTTLAISGDPNIGQAGYIHIDYEWMSYGGFERGGTELTLTNLTRGLNSSVQGAHTLGTNVYFGIAAHREDLFEQLINQVIFKLHALFLTNASPQETEHHVFQARFYKQLADEFWKGYVPPRSAKMKLTRKGIGQLA